jgi:hypothetical protein
METGGLFFFILCCGKGRLHRLQINDNGKDVEMRSQQKQGPATSEGNENKFPIYFQIKSTTLN